MTVRAVDMQTLIPRLGEAGRLQHHNDTQPHVTQHAQAASLQAKAEKAQQSVTQKPSAEQQAIRRDGGQKGGGGSSGGGAQSQGKKEEPARQAPVEAGRGHRLDVKV